MLFTSPREPDVGGSIEYVITLNAPADPRVNLRCIGKVVRCEKIDNDSSPVFAVAATLERYEFVRSQG